MGGLNLHPCPHCGANVTFNYNLDLEPTGVLCSKCRMVATYAGVRLKPSEPFGNVMARIAERWNRRAGNDV